MSTLQKTLESLSNVFEAQGIRWYVFGAQALNLYAMPRMTADVDVTIEPPSDLGKLLRAMTKAGFLPRVEDIDSFVETAAVIPLVSPQMIPVDVVIGTSGLERQILDRAQSRPLGDIRVPVATPEDLVVSKILAGRPKDLEDVRNLKTLGLDGEYIEEVLSQLEEALGISDLLPAFRTA